VPRDDSKPTISIQKYSSNKAREYSTKEPAGETPQKKKVKNPLSQINGKVRYDGKIPSDDVIQLAVELSCKIIGGDVHRVFHEFNNQQLSYFFRERDSRSRQLALMGLIHHYPDTSRTAVARKLGVSGNTAPVFYRNITNGLRNGTRKWLQQEMIDQVAAGIAQMIDELATSEASQVPIA
jgi:hypothetical protein